MTRYTATIHHHSLSRAPVVNAGNTLSEAKARAEREFGDEFADYTIVIVDRDAPNFDSEIVSRRRVGARKWIDLQ